MGKAGASLKLTLETYGISQNKLAVALGVERGSVYRWRWIHEIRDLTAETVRDIVKAIQGLKPAAAEELSSSIWMTLCRVENSVKRTSEL